jgi:diguanylate cyclase (GGDEF)-like protein
MKDALYLFVLMVLVSAVLSVTLRMMWRTLDQAAHVRTWTIAFAVGAVGFFLNILVDEFFPLSPLYPLVTGTLPIAVSYLLMLGYRQRAGLPLYHARFFGAITAVELLVSATQAVLPNVGIRLAAGPFFAAVMFWMAGGAASRKLAGGAERTAQFILYLFSGFDLLLGSLALRCGSGNLQAELLYEHVRMLGLPFFFITSGLMAVLVIASDMAARMNRLAETDTLTGLMNRRGIERAAKAAIERCHTAGRPLTALIADLDLFKKINDMYGHGIGDLALQRFSAYLRTSAPDPELLGRLGGEEFVLLLENTTEAQALLLTEQIRAGVAQIPTADLGLISMTSSFGIAEMLPGDHVMVDMLARADSALYAAKSAGRDRVYAFPTPQPGLFPEGLAVRKYRGAPLSTD